MSRKSFIIGFLILNSVGFIGTSWTQAASTHNVDMGKQAPPCGVAGASDIGFVDCASRTGGFKVVPRTVIKKGDTVKWTMRGTPHTVTSEAALTGGPAAACGTGDIFDSAIANSFTSFYVFTHTFNTPGTCNYFCIIHPLYEQGQIIVKPYKSPPQR